MTNTNLLKPWFYYWHNLKSKKSFPTGRGTYILQASYITSTVQ